MTDWEKLNIVFVGGVFVAFGILSIGTNFVLSIAWKRQQKTRGFEFFLYALTRLAIATIAIGVFAVIAIMLDQVTCAASLPIFAIAMMGLVVGVRSFVRSFFEEKYGTMHWSQVVLIAFFIAWQVVFSPWHSAPSLCNHVIY